MKKSNIRYYISKISIYVFAFCALYLSQRFIILSLFDVKKYILFNKVYAYELLLAILTAIEVHKGIKVSRPD
jgi:hypothetical protein